VHASRSFVRDERAALGWTLLQIGLVLLIPIALVVFWVKYIKRIQNDENAKNGPWAWGSGKSVMQAESTGDQKRQCPKCGLFVRPPRGSGPPICPNCMSIL
jgi:hypothetical protein